MKHIFLIFIIFTFITSNAQSIVTLDMPTPCTGPASVKENPKKNKSFDFTVTPNPAKAEFTLSITSDENLGRICVEIANTMGSIVLRETITGNATSYAKKINVTHLPQGSYVVTLYRKNERLSKKLILNKD